MAHPLTLVLELKPGLTITQIRELITSLQPAIDKGLEKVGTVHFARFTVFDASSPNLLPTDTSTGPFKLAVITSYDGDFPPYIQAFVNNIADVFDAVLPVCIGGESLVPVTQHVEAFTEFLAVNDATQHPPNSTFTMYSAYPQTVQHIRAAFPSGGK